MKLFDDYQPLTRPGFAGELPCDVDCTGSHLTVEWWMMTRTVSVVIEQDEYGCYAWCPELKGCQSQGKTVEATLANIREAIELFLESLNEEERSLALSREIFTTSVEVHG